MNPVNPISNTEPTSDNTLPAVFNHEEFGNIRVVMKDGEPWFVAKDVGDILEIRTDNIRTTLDDDEVCEANPYTVGVAPGGRAPLLISESGLYSLFLRSRKPVAKPLQRWITREVLPAIRKTGGYIPAKPDETPEQVALRGYEILIRTVEEQRLRIEADAPKVELADEYLHAEGDPDVGLAYLAKKLTQEGVTYFGAPFNKDSLPAFLRERGVLCKKKGQFWNTPTQAYIANGWFRVKERAFRTWAGTKTSRTTTVTPKGMFEITNRIRRWLDKRAEAVA